MSTLKLLVTISLLFYSAALLAVPPKELLQDWGVHCLLDTASDDMSISYEQARRAVRKCCGRKYRSCVNGQRNTDILNGCADKLGACIRITNKIKRRPTRPRAPRPGGMAPINRPGSSFDQPGGRKPPNNRPMQ